MAFLAPVTRPVTVRPTRHLLLAGLAVLAAAVVLALMPRHEAPVAVTPPATAQAVTPTADPPLRASAEPIQAAPAPAPRKVALATPPATHRSALAETDEASPGRSIPTDDLSEDAAAAGMTSRAEAPGPAQR